MKTSADFQRGFSLVELVVVMLLLGMIALACESGLHFGAQVWSRTESHTQEDGNLVSSQTILRELLANSLPRVKGDYVTFEGEPTLLSFDLVPPQAFQTGGTAHATLRITGSGATATLILEMRSIAAPSMMRRAILHDHVGLMRFAYLDASGGSQTWLSYWRDRSRLPDAVRITSSNGQNWPTLIVRPVITQSASCTLDLVNMSCRKI